MRKTITASWVLVTKLKTHNNLFLQDELANEYLVRAYSCKCGHDKIVTGDDINKNYVCKSCANDIFIDTNDICHDMESFVENTYYNRKVKLNFNMTFDVEVYKNKVQAVAKIKIPKKDLTSYKVPVDLEIKEAKRKSIDDYVISFMAPF